jgi:hypothetical protein
MQQRRRNKHDHQAHNKPKKTCNRDQMDAKRKRSASIVEHVLHHVRMHKQQMPTNATTQLQPSAMAQEFSPTKAQLQGPRRADG